MSTLITILGALIGVGGAVAGVVYYIRKSITNSVTLQRTDAALSVESQRVDALEQAQEAERKARVKEFDDKATAVRTVGDAAKLLEDATSGDPRLN